MKVIYDLQERGTGPVTISGMAERLSVSNSSVSGMLRKLNELGFVEHQRYGNVSLTETGTKAALAVLRRHRLLETYLVAELGYSWDEVHDEAEILEHVVSDKFVDRIAAHLGNPVVDPHGDPIPTREGTIVERESVLLSDAETGTSGVIVRVNDTDPELLRYLADIDIGIGMRVEVVERLPFAGSIRISVHPEKGGEVRDQALGLVAAGPRLSHRSRRRRPAHSSPTGGGCAACSRVSMGPNASKCQMPGRCRRGGWISRSGSPNRSAKPTSPGRSAERMWQAGASTPSP